MTAKRQNTPTEQNKEDNQLLTYRVEQLEIAVREATAEIRRRPYITPDDLKNFQDTIVTRFLDMRADLQKQIDSKAANSDLQDAKKVMYSVIGFGFSVMLAIMGFLLSKV